MQGAPAPAERQSSAPASRRKMKKQVSFSEQETNDDHPDRTGRTWHHRADRSLATGLATRSAYYYQTPKYPGTEIRRSYNLKHGQRMDEITQAALNQHSEKVRKVHIPKSMMNSSFLKHPDLTIGQKQYLWSIAKIYSTSHMQTCLNRQYGTGYRRQKEQASPSCEGSGLKIRHENQIKPQYLHQQQSQSETRKMSSKRLTSSLSAASRAYEPKENKERLNSGLLLKDRNKALNNLKPKKRKIPRQKDLTDELGSYVNGNIPRETALNKSMEAMSIKDKQEGVPEELDLRIYEENQNQNPAEISSNAESTEKEKETEGQQEDAAGPE